MRVLVADDEKLARQRVVRLLGEIEGVAIVAECTNADEVLAAVKEHEIDVAILDIEMPGLSGMEAFAMMGPRAPFVIFCTAHANYAVGDMSGAHLNPAVTLGFLAARRFEPRLVVPYIAGQCLGAGVASVVLRALFPDHH